MDGGCYECCALLRCLLSVYNAPVHARHAVVGSCCVLPQRGRGALLRTRLQACRTGAHRLACYALTLACHALTLPVPDPWSTRPLQAPTAAGRRPGPAPMAAALTARTQAAMPAAAVMAARAAGRGQASTRTTTHSTATIGRAPAAATGGGSSSCGGAAQAWVSPPEGAARCL